jgi:hypothetical protein
MITTTDLRTGAAACIGGTSIAILGIIGAIDSDLVGTVWFIVAAVSIWLFAAGVLGLSRSVTTPRVARGALTAAAGALFLFGAAHFYALVRGELLLSAAALASRLCQPGSGGRQ